MSSPGPRVDFYVLSETAAGARLHFGCRLTEKAWSTRATIHAHAGSAADARQLDEMLWTFRPGSFLPHALVSGAGGDGETTPITVGYEDPGDLSGDVLINLANEIPPFFDRFARVAEIVDGTPEGRQRGRDRFAFYRDNGYSPETHRID